MTTIANFPYFPLEHDADGKLKDGAQLTALQQHVTNNGATDVILIAHGFRNSEADASNLYAQFLTNFDAHLKTAEFQDIAKRKFAVGAVLWPSKSFKEAADSVEGHAQSVGGDDEQRKGAETALKELRDDPDNAKHKANLDKAIAMLDQIEDDVARQNEFVDLVLSVTDGIAAEPNEGLDKLRSKDGSAVLENLRTPVIQPTKVLSADGDGDGGTNAFTPPELVGDGGGTQGIGSFFNSVFGAVGTLLNVTTWYQMKNRSGVVGAAGVADAVRSIKTLPGAPRVHLVGHSLGGRLMASCAKSLSSPLLQPDSLTLLEAAFSHYGLSAGNEKHPEGFFRAVVTSNVVKGPLVATFSSKDTVVGLTYSVASRLAKDNVKSVGDRNDVYGGIGRNGAIDCDVAVEKTLHPAGTAYDDIEIGKVMCYDGSDNLINNHSDITNPAVTYLFASALTHTT
ncbi:MAG: hypothetical protein ABIT20_21425 [Gemmatimonadaceae bacterium]